MVEMSVKGHQTIPKIVTCKNVRVLKSPMQNYFFIYPSIRPQIGFDMRINVSQFLQLTANGVTGVLVNVQSLVEWELEWTTDL